MLQIPVSEYVSSLQIGHIVLGRALKCLEHPKSFMHPFPHIEPSFLMYWQIKRPIRGNFNINNLKTSLSLLLQIFKIPLLQCLQSKLQILLTFFATLQPDFLIHHTKASSRMNWPITGCAHFIWWRLIVSDTPALAKVSFPADRPIIFLIQARPSWVILIFRIRYVFTKETKGHSISFWKSF